VAVALGYITLPLGGVATIVIPCRSLIAFAALSAVAVSAFLIEAAAAARVRLAQEKLSLDFGSHIGDDI
jgi:hypothetical protein